MSVQHRWQPTGGPPGGHRVPAALRRTPAGDRGSASLWVLIVGLLVVAAGIAGAAVGAARVAHHEARAAAALGALAGAAHAVEGRHVACRPGAWFVRAHGGHPAEGHVDGPDIVVTVTVTVEPLPGVRRVAVASARAGPIRADAVSIGASDIGATDAGVADAGIALGGGVDVGGAGVDTAEGGEHHVKD